MRIVRHNSVTLETACAESFQSVGGLIEAFVVAGSQGACARTIFQQLLKIIVVLVVSGPNIPCIRKTIIGILTR